MTTALDISSSSEQTSPETPESVSLEFRKHRRSAVLLAMTSVAVGLANIMAIMTDDRIGRIITFALAIFTAGLATRKTIDAFRAASQEAALQVIAEVKRGRGSPGLKEAAKPANE